MSKETLVSLNELGKYPNIKFAPVLRHLAKMCNIESYTTMNVGQLQKALEDIGVTQIRVVDKDAEAVASPPPEEETEDSPPLPMEEKTEGKEETEEEDEGAITYDYLASLAPEELLSLAANNATLLEERGWTPAQVNALNSQDLVALLWELEQEEAPSPAEEEEEEEGVFIQDPADLEKYTKEELKEFYREFGQTPRKRMTKADYIEALWLLIQEAESSEEEAPPEAVEITPDTVDRLPDPEVQELAADLDLSPAPVDKLRENIKQEVAERQQTPLSFTALQQASRETLLAWAEERQIKVRKNATEDTLRAALKGHVGTVPANPFPLNGVAYLAFQIIVDNPGISQGVLQEEIKTSLIEQLDPKIESGITELENLPLSQWPPGQALEILEQRGEKVYSIVAK